MNLTEEELIELKLCVNEMIAKRQVYKQQEDPNLKLRLNKNSKFLKLDYKLLKKILKEIHKND